MRSTFVLLMLLAPLAALGDGMRCGNALITNGDSMLRVQHECGEPAFTHSYVSFGAISAFDPLRRVRADLAVPITVDEWTYNFGPTRFMRKLRFENGELILIEALQYGY
jgi:hypothetical protein